MYFPSFVASSSDVLTKSNKDLKHIEAHVITSHKLIMKFGRRDVMDKLLVLCGLVLFFSVVMYILKKRLWS